MSDLIFTTTMRLRNNGKEKASWHFVTVPKDLSKQIKEAQVHVEKKR
jgi:hypothetical protein